MPKENFGHKEQCLTLPMAIDIVGQSADIVDRNAVQARQLHNALKRYRTAVIFILSVVALRGFQAFGYLCLGHFMFFAEDLKSFSRIHFFNLSLCISIVIPYRACIFRGFSLDVNYIFHLQFIKMYNKNVI